MTEAIVKDSLVQESATVPLIEPKDFETKNDGKYVYIVCEDFTGKQNFYGLRNSEAFNFWDNPEEDIY